MSIHGHTSVRSDNGTFVGGRLSVNEIFHDVIRLYAPETGDFDHGSVVPTPKSVVGISTRRIPKW